MVPKIEDEVSKKRKNKSKNFIEFNDEITLVKCNKFDQEKSVKNKSKKKCSSTESFNTDINVIDKSVEAVLDNYNNETTLPDSQYQNKNEESGELLDNYDNDFNNREKNRSFLSPLGLRRPSLSGNTESRVVIHNSDRRNRRNRKFIRKLYKRKLIWYKNLIDILINASAKDSSLNNVIKNSLNFSKENINYNKEDKNANRNGIYGIPSNNEGRLIHIVKIPVNDTQKSIEFNDRSNSKIDEKIPEENYFSRPITSKAFKNLDETIDFKLSEILSLSEENSKPDNSDEKLAEKVNHNSDDNVMIHLYQKPKKCIEETEISETTSKTAIESEISIANSNSEEKNYEVRIECKELLQEDGNNSLTEDKRDELSPVIGGIKSSCSKEMRKVKLIRKINEPENSKNEKKSGVLNNPGNEEFKNKDTKDMSKIAWNKNSKKISIALNDKLLRNANELELKNTQKKGGSYCVCKRKKNQDIKFSGYKIPAKIEYPCLKIHKKCSNGINKAMENIVSSGNKEKASVSSYIGEKKTKKFYSSLELEYSGIAKSKWDPKHIVELPKDQIEIINSNKLRNDTPEVCSKKVNNKVITSKEKCSEKCLTKKVSKPPSKKFSLSNFTLSPNNSRNDEYPSDTKLGNSKNSSNSSKIPTFSKYSIPVSIEINISTNHDLSKRNFDMNLIQSKITKYFLPSYSVERDLKKIENNQNYSITVSKETNNSDENDNKISSINERREITKTIMKNNSKVTGTSRSLPKIESNRLLKNSEKVIYRKKTSTLRKPKLSISREDYLYDVLSDGNKSLKAVSTSSLSSLSNENCVTYKGEICQSINSKNNNNNNNNNIDNSEKRRFQSCNTDEKMIIEDSNNSIEDCDSIVPPSYSIFSNDYNYDDYNNYNKNINNNINNNKCIIDIEQILDTQQAQEMLAPWENVDIIEKINRWNENITMLD